MTQQSTFTGGPDPGDSGLPDAGLTSGFYRCLDFHPHRYDLSFIYYGRFHLWDSHR